MLVHENLFLPARLGLVEGIAVVAMVFTTNIRIHLIGKPLQPARLEDLPRGTQAHLHCHMALSFTMRSCIVQYPFG
jgi:hypothetical protein